MPLDLYISTKANPRGSLVISKDNATPSPVLESLVVGNTRETNIRFVDGNGDYEEWSGDETASLLVSIGRAGETLWYSTSWDTLENSSGWTGNISTAVQAIKELFESEGVNPLDLLLEVTVTDNESRHLTSAQIPIHVWNRVTDDDDLVDPPSPNNTFGSFSISNGVDAESVTGLALTAAPRFVIATIRKPSGGLNLFACVVAGSITTGGFDFTLSGVTDSANYKLDYYLIF